jgi:BirA family biotin operon repressor/biotin-[acetyl-CoA-carboxylase] ligase
MKYPLSMQVVGALKAVAETGSTNKDLLALTKSEELPELYTLITEYQSAGRGRLDRSWEAPSGSSIMASVLLRPKFADSKGIGWLSLLAAVAISKAVSELGIEAKIKWPNDVLIRGKKLSGVLAEASNDLKEIVVGFGINVTQQESDLPVESATSLALLGASSLDRDLVLSKTLEQFKKLYLALAANEGDAEASGLRSLVLEFSATVGEQVEVSFPDQSSIRGKAIQIDLSGRLVVETSLEQHVVSAGDVLHLRSV